MNEAVGRRPPDGERATTSFCPTSSPTRRTRRRTGGRPRQSCGTRSTARSTCSWPASARAARSPASGSFSRSATRAATSSPSSPPDRRSSPAGAPAHTGSRASERASSRQVLNREMIDEVIAGQRRRRGPDRARAVRSRGGARRDLGRRRSPRGDRDRQAAGVRHGADRDDLAGLGRALHLAGLVPARPLTSARTPVDTL